jgi:hypothetical protein
MAFRTIVKNLDFKQILSLIRWFLKHPLFMLATVWATYKTLRIAEREFPGIHNLHNKANALRHALWNVLIAKYASKFSNNIDEILNWTKTITDWHEDFSPNKIMPRTMDLHNNAFGRSKFNALKNKSIQNIVFSLKGELQFAVLVTKKTDFKGYSSVLVYLKE